MRFGRRVVAGSSNDGQTVVQSDTLHEEESVPIPKPGHEELDWHGYETTARIVEGLLFDMNDGAVSQIGSRGVMELQC